MRDRGLERHRQGRKPRAARAPSAVLSRSSRRQRVLTTHVVSDSWDEFCKDKRALVETSFRDIGIAAPLAGSLGSEVKIKATYMYVWPPLTIPPRTPRHPRRGGLLLGVHVESRKGLQIWDWDEDHIDRDEGLAELWTMWGQLWMSGTLSTSVSRAGPAGDFWVISTFGRGTPGAVPWYLHVRVLTRSQNSAQPPP